SVGHEERAVAAIGSDVDRGGVASGARLEAEDARENRDTVEDAVGKTGPMKALPGPPGGIAAELALEVRDSPRERCGLEVRAGLARGSPRVVAPGRVTRQRVDEESGTHAA